MDRRIQQALDGELPVGQLTSAEREELAVCERAIAQAVAEVPDPGPAPDMSGAVMWRIAHEQLPAPAGLRLRQRLAAWPRALQWLVRPQSLTLRPVTALASIILVVAAVAAVSRSAAPPMMAATDVEAGDQLVQFRLGAPGVTEVALVGDFGGWSVRYPMEQVAPGVWATSLPLEPGVYDYAFVVDGGTFVLDPLAPSVADGFGGANSRLSVLAPERRVRT